MSNNQIPVIKFLFKEDIKSLNEALRLTPGYEVEEFSAANDLATFLSTIPAGLVIASLKNKDDLVQIASYIKLGKRVAKECAVKVVVFNFSNDRTYEKAIAKLGILDVVEPNINTKALKFKLDFWMKSLTAQAKLSNKGESQKVIKASDQNKQGNQEKKPDPSQPVWVPPLEIEDDIWLIKNETEVKKILGKWLIRIVGPSPYVGQWVELKAGLWRYDIKESEKELYVPNDGAWYFAGDQKPDFVWKDNNWLITGENFDLFFKDAKQITSRLKSKDRVLTVSKNSLYAKTKEQIIVESFDKELVFKKEAERMENLEGDSKGEKSLNGNLEGKNKTEQIDNSSLEGKTKTAADKSGNLKGKLENQEAINNELLEKKADNSKLKTHWDGKNEYQQETASDLDVKGDKARKDKNLDQDNDTEHEKYYKNHNEAKQFGKADLDKKQKPEAEYEEQQAKDMKGKSSTDEIPAYYDNSKKSKERSEKEERSEEMSLKSDTDRLKTHYGQKDTDRAEKDTELPDDLKGKSETERLKTHYGQKEDAERSKNRSEKSAKERQFSDDDAESFQEETGALSGKSETEKLKSHYGKKETTERPEKELDERDFSSKAEFEKAKALKEEREQKERKIAEREEREQKERKIAEREERELKERKFSEKEREQLERKRADREKEEGSDAMSGKSSTDKIAGHYGRPKDREAVEKESREAAEELAALKQLERKYKEKSAPGAEDLYARPDRERTEETHDDSFDDQSENDKAASKNRGSADADRDMYAREKKSGSENTHPDTGRDMFAHAKKSRPGQTPADNKIDDLFDDYLEDSESSKLSSQSTSKKTKSIPGKAEDHDELSEARADRKTPDRDRSNDGKIADILPLNRAKTEKAKEATKIAMDEKGLDELTRDAKVLSVIEYKGKKITCELNDFFDDTIIFMTQEKSIEISSKVQLDLVFKFLEKDKKLNMEGSVTTVDGDGEGNNFVTVQLSKENTAAFDVFMRLYETRQSNVNEFIKKVKGL